MSSLGQWIDTTPYPDYPAMTISHIKAWKPPGKEKVTLPPPRNRAPGSGFYTFRKQWKSTRDTWTQMFGCWVDFTGKHISRGFEINNRVPNWHNGTGGKKRSSEENSSSGEEESGRGRKAQMEKITESDGQPSSSEGYGSGILLVRHKRNGKLNIYLVPDEHQWNCLYSTVDYFQIGKNRHKAISGRFLWYKKHLRNIYLKSVSTFHFQSPDLLSSNSYLINIHTFANDPVLSFYWFFFFQYCAGQRFIAALSHTGGQARKN